MYYQTGNMRDINLNNDQSPMKNSVIWDRQNQFQYAQKSKYQKSQVSYPNGHNQRSRLIYDQQKTDRLTKTNQSQNNQIAVTVPIKIKSSERQDYTNSFKIQLLSMLDKNNTCLTMHITNDNDSLFLWSFFVRQSEFLNLKNQQSLKVDFHGFPEVIMTYLNSCKNSDKQIINLQSNDPRFYAVLQIKKGNLQAQLKILQANKYKQSLHLSLIFKKSNDQQVKIYLAHKYDKQRKQKAKIYNQLFETQSQLSNRLQQLQKNRIEFEQMQKQKNQRISQLQKRERQKIKQLTLRIEQQNMKKQKQETQKTTKSISDLNDKIQQLKRKNQSMLVQYQKSNHRVIQLQTSQKALKYSCQTLQRQVEQYQKNLKQLKDNQKKNIVQIHNLQNQNTKNLCTMQYLEDRLKQKQQRISQNMEMKSNNYNQISTLEQNLRQQKQKLTKQQQKNQMLQLQIAKLQKKCEDLNNKYQKKKDKTVDYKQIITAQQQKIERYEKQEKRSLQQIVELKRQRDRWEMQIKDRQTKIKDLKTHIQQKTLHIQNNQKIISQLHKKVNEKSVGIKTIPISGTLPTYAAFNSTNSTLGRQFSSTLSSNSESRLRYSPSPISTNPINDKSTDKIIAPPFRKYRQGIQNDKDQQNSHHASSHSRSPILSKLNQQLDPQDVDKTKEKIGPIKFKK